MVVLRDRRPPRMHPGCTDPLLLTLMYYYCYISKAIGIEPYLALRCVETLASILNLLRVLAKFIRHGCVGIAALLVG